VEEDEKDTDYYVTPMTIELLERAGAGLNLIEMLKRAVGNSDGVDVVWKDS